MVSARKLRTSAIARAPVAAILLAEQYFDFARELARRITVVDRGEIVIDDAADRLDPEVVKRHIDF